MNGLEFCKWYDIPPSHHRVLVHGEDIIRATPLPIGQTSEEGSESNTKFARKYHVNHTRKSSQNDTMHDLFHRLMDVSDPIIVGMSSEKKCPKKTLPADMAELFQKSSEHQEASHNE